MNTLTKGFAKRVLSMLLATIMVFSLGIVGLTTASAANIELAETGAQYNLHWQGKIYFLAPSSWNIDTYKYIQVDITRTTSATSSNHQEYIGTMTRVGTSRLFYLQVDANHSGWGQNEYIAFTANDHEYGSGTFNLNGNHYYTTPLDYGCNNSSNYYLFKPSTEAANTASNGNTMTGSYGSSRDTIIAKQTVNITCDGVASSACGTVKMSGYYDSADNSVTSSSATSSGSTISYDRAVQGSAMTLTGTPKTGYKFVGWYSGSTLLSSNATYTYNVFNTKTITAKFAKNVSFGTATATINTNSVVVGNSADITVNYTVTGSTATPTLTLCDASGNAINTANYTVNGKVITVTPPVAGNYTYKVKITVDGVSTFTNEVTLECKKEYSASLGVDNTTKYTDDNFNFTITDNSDLYDNVTYKVYCNDALVTPVISDKIFTVSHAVAGDYTYKVVATVDGNDVETNEINITVKAKIFSVYLEAPKSTMEDRPFTIKATSEFADPNVFVEYTLTGPEGINITNNSGDFEVTVHEPGEYTFTVVAVDGVNENATRSIKVVITEDKGSYPVKIYFKTSDTYGYLPHAKINGEAINLVKDSAIICYNATDSATYSWYSYTSETQIDFGTEIVFAVNATRNYFYNASYSVFAGDGDYVVDEDGYYCYYLALENLNGGSNVLTNISTMNEEERNWTESAVNMIFDDKDTLIPVALNYAYADMADANTDGSVNIKDATYIQKNLAEVVEASELSETVSDVNGDSKVTIKDATAIQKQLAGL